MTDLGTLLASIESKNWSAKKERLEIVETVLGLEEICTELGASASEIENV